jgi:hypothetical protein
MASKIATSTGRLVDPFAIQPNDLCVFEIAHSLALLNRFVGHTREPYTVRTICDRPEGMFRTLGAMADLGPLLELWHECRQKLESCAAELER